MDTEFRCTTYLPNGVTLTTENEEDYDVYVTQFWDMRMQRPRIICRSENKDDAKNNHYSILDLVELITKEG